jgi:hypothetical protein
LLLTFLLRLSCLLTGPVDPRNRGYPGGVSWRVSYCPPRLPYLKNLTKILAIPSHDPPLNKHERIARIHCAASDKLYVISCRRAAEWLNPHAVAQWFCRGASQLELLPPTWQYERLPNREPDWAIGRALRFGVPIRQSRILGSRE